MAEGNERSGKSYGGGHKGYGDRRPGNRGGKGFKPRGNLEDIDEETLESVLDGFKVVDENGEHVFPVSKPGDRVIDAAQAAGLFKSASEARRAIKSGGVYLNNNRIEDEEQVLAEADFLAGRFALIRRGKKALGAVENR